MDINLINSTDAVGRFCRLHMNTKRDIPIRPSEMGVLIFAQKQKDPVTPLMIAQFFRIAKPSVTSMVNALVKQEYLAKEPSVTDKRSYILNITQKGDELVQSTFMEYFKSIELLKKKMGEDKFQQFIGLIQLANGILEEEKVKGTGI